MVLEDISPLILKARSVLLSALRVRGETSSRTKKTSPVAFLSIFLGLPGGPYKRCCGRHGGKKVRTELTNTLKKLTLIKLPGRNYTAVDETEGNLRNVNQRKKDTKHKTDRRDGNIEQIK